MLHEWQINFARCLRDPASTPPVMPDHLARFAIYRDSVLGSLVAALAEAYPVTRLIVGSKFFDAVAGDYARRQPPISARLAAYGGTFPNYLRDLAALHDLPYVADVALLEWERIEAYFAGAAEAVVTADMLMDYPVADLPLLRFRPVPSLRLVDAPTAIWSIWMAHQAVEPELANLDIWQPQSVRLLCNRRHVVMQPLRPGRFRFLAALVAGLPLIDAVGAAQAAEAGFDLQAALVEELQAGTFGAIASCDEQEA